MKHVQRNGIGTARIVRLVVALCAASCGGGGGGGATPLVLGPNDVATTTDAAGRVTEQRDVNGRIARYEYDAAGNLTAITRSGPP